MSEELYSDVAIGKIWEILGVTTYEQANGKSIDELVADLKAENAYLEKLSEYVQHDAGCNYPFNERYGCRCGLLDIQKANPNET